MILPFSLEGLRLPPNPFEWKFTRTGPVRASVEALTRQSDRGLIQTENT
jgi:hypothetical protein